MATPLVACVALKGVTRFFGDIYPIRTRKRPRSPFWEMKVGPPSPGPPDAGRLKLEFLIWLRARLMDSYDGMEKLRLAEVDTGQPGPGEARVAIRFAALNSADTFLSIRQ